MLDVGKGLKQIHGNQILTLACSVKHIPMHDIARTYVLGSTWHISLLVSDADHPPIAFVYLCCAPCEICITWREIHQDQRFDTFVAVEVSMRISISKHRDVQFCVACPGRDIIPYASSRSC